mmetsp:Transcript_657/g.1008  ORF Transcript_657/g.1008 Transcript_657/m.1008 type:complete len:402 (+) Transcript_657:3-1208(+)
MPRCCCLLSPCVSVASRLGVGLNQYWGTCRISTSTAGEDVSNQYVSLWAHLFGKDEVLIHSSNRYAQYSATASAAAASPLLISNEVPGYKSYATRQLRDSELARQLFEASIVLYRQLRTRFLERHYRMLQSFIKKEGKGFFDRNQYVVIGIHVRAGNGETGEFVEKGREIEDMSDWVESMTAVICRYIADEGLAAIRGKQRILLYVATDTASVIDLIRDAFINTDIEVVSFPQTRNDGVGPSYQVDDESCLEAWENQMVDMILLSLSDVLVAARYSSFTQTMPLALLFGDMRGQQRHSDTVSYPYCETSREGTSMACFKSFQGWKARTRPSNPHRIVYQSSGRVDWEGEAILDGHEDALTYPLATKDCLVVDEHKSSEYYFLHQDCLQAHLLCKVNNEVCQ